MLTMDRPKTLYYKDEKGRYREYQEPEPPFANALYRKVVRGKLEKAKHCIDMLIEMEYGECDPMKTNPVSIKPKEKAKLILFLESGELVSGFYYNEMWYYDQLSINSDGGVYSTILNSYKGHGVVGWIYANAK